MPHPLQSACTPVAKPRFKALRDLSGEFAAAERIADNFSDLENDAVLAAGHGTLRAVMRQAALSLSATGRSGNL
ncbi:hypothetical protein S23_44660 [Bradyrhizobium cosmicum]|uniref:Uncharacterized protein n=1 Tax=Bradyrhizobium cosmicum TaxID=1404864 RepID=A0AAI8MFQ2_9BRAD|nr:hypothetical protein S23_44660 [Bradyrhizobium cosmicum]